MSRNRFIITQTLLSSWNWIYKSDSGYDDFIKTLNKQGIRPTQAILDGRKFENMVTAYCEGHPPEQGHQWYNGICSVGEVVRNGAFQVKLYKDVTVKGVDFLLYGILDVLKCGEIFDIKFSKTYHVGKYLDSPQHPMYFELCPEARKFTYIVSNGKDVYREEYLRENVEPIEREIVLFMDFLEKQNLVDIYCEKWRSK